MNQTNPQSTILSSKPVVITLAFDEAKYAKALQSALDSNDNDFDLALALTNAKFGI